MPDETPEDLIRYDILTQDAMRGVVKKIITETAKAGLPGEHHFFVSFLTDFPNVRLSTRMRERYPDEMTIVIQHQYWDLKAHENSFEIGLSFDDIPESLSIPFAAIKGFFDPSVQFGLQFDVDDEAGEPQNASTAIAAVATDDNEAVVIEPEILKTKKKSTTKAKKKKKTNAVTDKAKNDSATANDKEKDDESSGAEVVSLDAFRKKP
jgi:hypothetical protein